MNDLATSGAQPEPSRPGSRTDDPSRTPAKGSILAGPLDGPLVRLWVPLLVGYLFQIGFAWVNTYLVADLGQDALAAVGSTMFVTWGLMSIAEIASVGTLALVARAVGAKDRLAAGAAGRAGVLLGLSIGLVTAVALSALAPAVVATMHLAPAPAALATEYLRVLAWGYPTLVLFSVLEAVFRGAGDTRTPMFILAGAFALNALLDWLLIRGVGPLPALGVAGAAWGTTIARGLGVVALAVALRRRGARLGLALPIALAPGTGSFRAWFDLALQTRMARIGLPACAAGLGFSAIYLALVRIAAEFGTAAVAALGVGLRFEGLAFVIVAAIGRAAATFAGQNLGANQPARAVASARQALRHACLAMVPMGLLMAAWPEECVRWFSEEPEVTAAAAQYIALAACALIPMAFEVVHESVAGGTGNTFVAMLIEVVGTLVRIPIAMGLAAAGLGFESVCWAVALTVALKAVAFEVWFRRAWGSPGG